MEKLTPKETELIGPSVENIYINTFNILRELWRGINHETSSDCYKNQLEVSGIKNTILEINRWVKEKNACNEEKITIFDYQSGEFSQNPAQWNWKVESMEKELRCGNWILKFQSQCKRIPEWGIREGKKWQ